MFLNKVKVKELVKKTNGRFFSVVFKKRTTLMPRKMVCRTGVAKYVKGVGKRFNPEEHDLVTVWSMKDKQYRNIPIDTVTSIACNGKSYIANK